LLARFDFVVGVSAAGAASAEPTAVAPKRTISRNLMMFQVKANLIGSRLTLRAFHSKVLSVKLYIRVS
jgi:hypothetical protein